MISFVFSVSVSVCLSLSLSFSFISPCLSLSLTVSSRRSLSLSTYFSYHSLLRYPSNEVLDASRRPLVQLLFELARGVSPFNACH